MKPGIFFKTCIFLGKLCLLLYLHFNPIIYLYPDLEGKFMLTWTKYRLDRRRLRQARKAIPAVTCWLPMCYCRNLGELVPVKGGIISSDLSLIEGNRILPITPRDGCGIVVQHRKNILNPFPDLLRGVASHQTQIVTPISNWPQRRQLCSDAVKYLPFNIKVEKIRFEGRSMFFAFSHFNNFFVTHGHIPAIFNFLDLILSELSHNQSPQHSKTYLQSLKAKTETHLMLWQS